MDNHCPVHNLGCMKQFPLIAALLLAACGGAPSPSPTYGAAPELPAPEGGLPTVNPARAVGWSGDAAPVAAEGFTVTRFANGLAHPRWLYLLPNGDVLVAESSTRPTSGGGIMGWIVNTIQERAGALSESADRITLLRDNNGDGVVDQRHVFAENLNQPFGMALVGDYLYIANTDEVRRFAYTADAVRLTGEGERVLELPYHEGDNGHWTRNLIANADGTKLYVAIGSATNIADQGMEIEQGRAAIWEFNPDGSGAREFATDGTFLRQYGSGWIRGAAVVPGNQLWIGGVGSSTIGIFDLASGAQTGSLPIAGLNGAFSMNYSATTNTLLIVDVPAGAVLEADLAGAVLRFFDAPQGASSLHAVTRGPGGDIFASNGQAILRWRADGTFVGSVSTAATIGNAAGIVWAGSVPEPDLALVLSGGAAVFLRRSPRAIYRRRNRG